jgi:hypothetical protein
MSGLCPWGQSESVYAETESTIGPPRRADQSPGAAPQFRIRELLRTDPDAFELECSVRMIPALSSIIGGASREALRLKRSFGATSCGSGGRPL